MKHLYFFLGLACLNLYAKDNIQQGIACDKGNFQVPASQQPGPMIGFGDNMLPKNSIQVYFSADAYINKDGYFTDVAPSVVYGITDYLSLFVNVPYATRYKSGNSHSSGIEDLVTQLEYAFYTKEKNCHTHQFTLVGNASFPTGSIHKNPPTGYGSMSYFVGGTYTYMNVNWLCFTAYGAQLTTHHEGTRRGFQYLYQFGFGRLIGSYGGWIFDWIVEIDGTFYEKDKYHGVTDPNSGGNVIYVTPSLWASSNDWIIQLGLGYAVQQHFFGNQERSGYLLYFDVGRAF